jgi:hypothetical protein
MKRNTNTNKYKNTITNNNFLSSIKEYKLINLMTRIKKLNLNKLLLTGKQIKNIAKKEIKKYGTRKVTYPVKENKKK